MKRLVRASGGAHIISWSQSGRFLMVAGTVSRSLSIYNTETWESEVFILRRPVRHALWGSNDVVCYVLEGRCVSRFAEGSQKCRFRHLSLTLYSALHSSFLLL